MDGTPLAFTDGVSTFRSAFAVATVTLDGGENSITISRTSGQLNAVVLSQTPPPVPAPEPTGALLVGLALPALALYRRRRMR